MRCANCGKTLSITEFLSMDEHLCNACYLEKYPESVKALSDAGHEVMNHSDRHAHMPALSPEARFPPGGCPARLSSE